MVIYLRHPLHGNKVATSDLEASADADNGWVRFDPSAPVVEAPAAPPPVVDSPAPVNALQGKRQRKTID